MYIHERPGWPDFSWDESRLAVPLADVKYALGRLSGEIGALNQDLRDEAALETFSEDALRSSEIEGERLPPDSIRSSIARQLGLSAPQSTRPGRNVEGIVTITLDATRNATKPMTAERLKSWHAALFPTGYSGLKPIAAGAWRKGGMQIVSGAHGRERVHFTAPAASRVPAEMERFLGWCEGGDNVDGIVKAAIAHFWFVTIHPFDDGNGRIARAIGDLMLVRAEGGSDRWYSLSAQIMRERAGYYAVLEDAETGTLDITAWLLWFLECLGRAVAASNDMLRQVRGKARFWQSHAGLPLNERQRKVLAKLLDGFQGKLTTSKWASLGKCSQDTAHRDIMYLLESGVLKQSASGGRSTSYYLVQESSP